MRTHARLAYETVGVMVSPVPPGKTADSSLLREERADNLVIAPNWMEEQFSLPA
jgi:hypothetical protein